LVYAVLESVSHGHGHCQRLAQLESTLAVLMTESEAPSRRGQNELQHVACCLNAVGGRQPATSDGCRLDDDNDRHEHFVLSLLTVTSWTRPLLLNFPSYTAFPFSISFETLLIFSFPACSFSALAAAGGIFSRDTFSSVLSPAARAQMHRPAVRTMMAMLGLII